MLLIKRSLIFSVALSALLFFPTNILYCNVEDRTISYQRGLVYELRHSNDIDIIIKNYGARGVILDFGAPWCGFCKRAYPKFKELAAQYPDIAFVTINIEDANGAGAAIAQKYGVRNLPTFLFIFNGSIQDRLIGFDSAALIQKVYNFVQVVG